MFDLALKVILMFVIGIFIMRIMGKSAITQLTPYDLIAIIIIGTVIAEPLISTKIKPTLFVLLVLAIFYILFSKLSLNQFFNKLLLGRPTILIKHGKIIEENIEKEHISLIQLTSILRVNGYPKLEDIEYAILEPTGEISIIPKPEVRGVTANDLNIEVEYEGLPIGVIIDGKIQDKNLKIINKDKKWLEKKLKEEGIYNIKDIVYAYATDQKDDLVYDLRNQKTKLKNINENKILNEKKSYIVKDSEIIINTLQELGIHENELKEKLNIKSINDLKKYKNIVIKEIKQIEIQK